MVQPKDRIMRVYGEPGKECWAVITGGSDGIGLAMAHNLAAQGFNICIVARNEQKMKDCLADITKKVSPAFPGFKTMYIVADFGKIF